MLIVGAALPGYARGDLDSGYRVQEAETLFAGIAAILALGFATTVYRGLRQQLSPQFVFHGAFFLGLSLLGYCLWATLTLFPLLDNSLLITDWTTHILPAAFAGPILCQFVIAAALLLLVFATLLDNNRDA